MVVHNFEKPEEEYARKFDDADIGSLKLKFN